MVSSSASESLVTCARCGVAHGLVSMRLGRSELALDPQRVSAVRRVLTGGVEVACRACGHATHHQASSVKAIPPRAA